MLLTAYFLESKSCIRACAGIRGFIALSKWKDSSKPRKMRIEHKQWKVRLCTRANFVFVLQYELSGFFPLVMKIWSFLGFAVSYLQDSTKSVLPCIFLILFAIIQSTVFICPEDIKVHFNQHDKKGYILDICSWSMLEVSCFVLCVLWDKTGCYTGPLHTESPPLPTSQFRKLMQPGLIHAWTCILVNRAN